MKKIYLLFTLAFLCSCGNNYTYVLHSPDRKQAVTIICKGKIRYIIDGNHDEIPEENYVKIDLSSTPIRNNDEIVGCWKTDELDWHIINDGAIVLENKLDPERFKFGTAFPEDKQGIPTILDFSKPGCFDLGFEYNQILGKRGELIVE